MRGAHQQPDAETRRHRASVSRKLWLGGSILLLAAIALVWAIWGFRWPPAAEVVGQVAPESRAEQIARRGEVRPDLPALPAHARSPHPS